jgi:hypothetical protein
MIQTLEGFETRFSELENTTDGQKFKAGLRTAFNDVMRAQRDELYDYDVEFRPMRADDDRPLSITKTFLETVQRMEFGVSESPYFKIYGAVDRGKVLQAIRSEFGSGVVYEESESLVLEIVGIESCVNCVLPIMDRYRLHSGVRENYYQWREELIKLYRS